jgi:hypothetical protein
MIRRFTLILSLTAAFSASGLPLGVLQLSVWANMFDQFYNETNSVMVSAERVLDGQNRCLGCDFVTDQGTSTKEAVSAVIQSPEKIPLVELKATVVSFFNPLVRNQISIIPQSPHPVFEKTETPPPRLFA